MSDKTKISLAGTLAAGGIDHLADQLWNSLGDQYPALVRLEVCERTEPSDTEADRKVKLRVVAIEMPITDASRTTLDQQLHEAYVQRTGNESLFDDPESTGNVERDDQGRIISVTIASESADRIGKIADRLADHEDDDMDG